MVGFRDGWKVSEELSVNFTISVKFLLLYFGSEGGSHSWSHQPKVHEFERPTVSSLLLCRNWSQISFLAARKGFLHWGGSVVIHSRLTLSVLCLSAAGGSAGAALRRWSASWTWSRQVTLSAVLRSVNETFTRCVVFVWLPQKFYSSSY